MSSTTNPPAIDLTTEGYLTPAAVARRLDCDITTVYRYLATGKLAGLRIAGHRYLIRPSALAALIQPACPCNPEVARA